MKNVSLTELQTSLQNYLLGINNTVVELTTQNENVSSVQRLEIYHEGYRLRLIEALRNDYPALEFILGGNEFCDLMSEYVSNHPSTNPSLRWLGKSLPEFLRSHSRYNSSAHIYELAAFEWAQIMAFDAADITPITIDELRSLQNHQWLDLQLHFQPALQLFSCVSNAPQLWQAGINDGNKIEAVINNENQNWLIWRSELQVLYRPIDILETKSLTAFLQHKNFSDVCEILCGCLPADQVPLKAAQNLQQWIKDGMVAAIDVKK